MGGLVDVVDDALAHEGGGILTGVGQDFEAPVLVLTSGYAGDTRRAQLDGGDKFCC